MQIRENIKKQIIFASELPTRIKSSHIRSPIIRFREKNSVFEAQPWNPKARRVIDHYVED